MKTVHQRIQHSFIDSIITFHYKSEGELILKIKGLLKINIVVLHITKHFECRVMHSKAVEKIPLKQMYVENHEYYIAVVQKTLNTITDIFLITCTTKLNEK